MLLEQLELVEVEYEFEGKKAVLTFLDEENGEIREVNFNKQDYQNGKFVEDEKKAEKVEEWADKYFGTSFDEMAQAIGTKHDIYAYDNFNSMFEVEIVEKFDKDMVGQIITVPITEVFDDGIGIRINFEYKGKTYQNKMTYSDYVKARNEWFVNPQKKRKQYARFEKKFNVPFEQADELVGKEVMVEIRLAMGKYVWADIKPLQKD